MKPKWYEWTEWGAVLAAPPVPQLRRPYTDEPAALSGGQQRAVLTVSQKQVLQVLEQNQKAENSSCRWWQSSRPDPKTRGPAECGCTVFAEAYSSGCGPNNSADCHFGSWETG